jgi:hypothetical protein
MPVKPMPANLLLDLIFDHYQTRSEFLNWKETVIDQINNLYAFKEKYWKLAQEKERRTDYVDQGIKDIQSILDGGDN